MNKKEELKELEKILQDAIKNAKKSPPPRKKRANLLGWLIAGAVVFFAGFYVFFAQQSTLVSLEQLKTALPQAKSAEIFLDEITLELASGQRLSSYASEAAIAAVSERLPLQSNNASALVAAALAMLAGILLANYLRKSAAQRQAEGDDGYLPRADGRNGGRSGAENVYFNAPQNVSFDDVLGASAAKKELRKIIAQMQSDKPLKALLFEGASGVGKTMLARALASAVHCGFFYASASSFNELFVGMGAKRVRELFAAARKVAPCVIFIDEIDALGTARGSLLNKESEHTLNELLVQMDGFAATPGVLLIAATNRADVLDPALLRRFSKRIVFELPNVAEREEFVRAYGLVPAMSAKQAVALTAGFSGADFAAVAEELETAPARDEKSVAAAIALRRFGLAAAAEFSQADAISQAAMWTVAEMLGAEVYHALGRVIWQLNMPRTRSRAQLEAAINFSAQAGCKLLLGDEYASNLRFERAGLAALEEFALLGGGALGAAGAAIGAALGAANALEQEAAAAREQAAEYVALRKELIEARAAVLSAEAQQEAPAQ